MLDRAARTKVKGFEAALAAELEDQVARKRTTAVVQLASRRLTIDTDIDTDRCCSTEVGLVDLQIAQGDRPRSTARGDAIRCASREDAETVARCRRAEYASGIDRANNRGGRGGSTAVDRQRVGAGVVF